MLLGSDTLDAGNSNTSIVCEIDECGGLLNAVRYINDTVYGISTYAAKSYVTVSFDYKGSSDT